MATGVTERERNGWRDEGISRRHRLWGVECQATDIDWLVLEYRCEYKVVRAVAFIEYKNENAPRKDDLLPYHAIRQVSNSAELPFFVVRYTSDFKTYLVIAMNEWAKIRLQSDERQFTEEKFVHFLYWLRGYGRAPEKVLDAIKKHDDEIQTKLSTQPSLF